MPIVAAFAAAAWADDTLVGLADTAGGTTLPDSRSAAVKPALRCNVKIVIGVVRPVNIVIGVVRAVKPVKIVIGAVKPVKPALLRDSCRCNLLFIFQ